MKYEFTLYPDVNDITMRILGEIDSDDLVGQIKTTVTETHKVTLRTNDLMEFIPDLREMLKEYNEHDGTEYRFESDYGTSSIRLRRI